MGTYFCADPKCRRKLTDKTYVLWAFPNSDSRSGWLETSRKLLYRSGLAAEDTLGPEVALTHVGGVGGGESRK